MSSTRSGGAPDERGGAPVERDTGHWTTETLPLAVRKQLLERELKQLGFRKAGQGGVAREGSGSSPQQQQSPGADDTRPTAPADGDSHGGD